MRSISFPISLGQDFRMQRERILPFMLAGLLMLGLFLSSWTLQSYKPSHPSVKPLHPPPVVIIKPPIPPAPKVKPLPPSPVVPTKPPILPPLPIGGDDENPPTPDQQTCQKPPKIQFDGDPTIKERVRRGINSLERHPNVTAGAWAVLLASPLLLTSLPVIAVAAVVVPTFLFVRGALGAC